MYPKRLINISQSCKTKKIMYVNYEYDGPYIAISHVWSKVNKEQQHEGVTWKISAFLQDNVMHLLEMIYRCFVDTACNAIWIDAYCIDQTNQEEKGYEIVRMGDYYSAAIKVVVLPNGIDGI